MVLVTAAPCGGSISAPAFAAYREPICKFLFHKRANILGRPLFAFGQQHQNQNCQRSKQK